MLLCDIAEDDAELIDVVIVGDEVPEQDDLSGDLISTEFLTVNIQNYNFLGKM